MRKTWRRRVSLSSYRSALDRTNQRCGESDASKAAVEQRDLVRPDLDGCHADDWTTPESTSEFLMRARRD